MTAIIILGLMLLLSGSRAFANTEGPKIWTDQPDYPFRSVVTIYGTGFTPEAAVNVTVTNPDGTQRSWLATPDSSGSLVTTYQLEAQSGLYLVSAEQGNLYAATAFFDSDLIKDFKQCANKDQTLGQCHWITSILQKTNSKYYEGMSVPQRVIFESIPATTGNVHTLNFQHMTAKGTIHAYDFLTSFAQATATSDGLIPAFIGSVLSGSELNNKIPPSDVTGLLGAYHQSITIPDSMGTSPSTSENTDPIIAAYEASEGDRTIDLYAMSPITSASLVFDGYIQGGGADYANYTLTWTSSSSKVMVLYAGHLAEGENGYGVGLGSSNINGGPYHFMMKTLDSASLGSLDNQIQGADILVKPAQIVIVKNTEGGDGTFPFTTTGGNGLPSSFSLVTSGGTATLNFTVTKGTYSVSETVPYGWKLESATCTSGTPTNITLAAGSSVTCTFNDTKLATVVVVKDAIGGDGTFGFITTGGSTLSSSFNITTTGGTGSRTFNNVDPDNVYSVNETIPSGWKLVSATCTAGTPSNFTVAAGGSVTCTFSDTKLGNIVVEKTAIGGDAIFNFTGVGGSTLPAAFGVNTTSGYGSVAYHNVNPGEYNVTEIVPAGWKLESATCTSGTPSNFTVVAGGTVTCSFTDKKLGTIIVVKNTLGGDGNFSFVGTGGSALPASFIVETATGSGNTTFVDVDPDNTYSVTETVPAGWKLESASCTSGIPASFNVPAGGSVTCNFDNKKLGTIIVVKNTIGGDGNFSFVGTGGSTFPDAFYVATTDGSGNRTYTNVDPDNSYRVTETVPIGWKLESSLCTTGTPADFTVPAGGSVTCTFVDKKLGTIVVEKTAIGGDDTFSFVGTGGSTLPSGFDITTASGYGNTTFYNVDPDNFYSVDETVPAGWKLESATCTLGIPGNFTVPAGGSVACSFTDKKLGTIIIEKTAVGGDGTFNFNGTGGSTLPSGFSVVTTSGFGSVTYSNVDPDNFYSVNETVPAGWKLDSATCTAGTPANFTVPVGGSVTCSFTDKKLGTIIVVKNTLGGDGNFSYTSTGGSNLPADFLVGTEDGTGNVTYNDIDPDNVYSVSETFLSGWKLENAVCTSGTPVSFEVAPGTSVTCTFENKKLGTIVVVKNTMGGDGTFEFIGTGGSTFPASFNITTTTRTGSVTYLNVDPDNTYNVTETIPTGWKLVNSTCTSGTPASFEVPAGGTVTCTFTDKKLGTIVVEKVTVGGDGNFSFVGTGGSTLPDDFDIVTASGSGNVTYYNVDPDNTYSIEETVPAGWKFVSSNCTGAGNTADEFTVTAGGTVTCSFVDKKLGTIVVEKTTAGGDATFVFNGTGGSNLPDQFNIATVSGFGNVTYIDIDPDNTYSIEEIVPAGWALNGSSCSGTGNTPSEFKVPAGGTVTCTFDNYKLGTVVVVKNAQGGDSTFSYETTGGSTLPGTFSITTINGAGNATFLDVEPGSYSVAELAKAGWTLLSSSCTGTGNSPENFTVGAGETVTCTFSNEGFVSLVTDSALCRFDVDDGVTGSQFRLTFIQDPLSPGHYILKATNPGQFYYNAMYSGTPGTSVTINLMIPYPFVTQGAVPVHVYSGFTYAGGCLTPGSDVTGSFNITGGSGVTPPGYPSILLSGYSTTTLTQTITATGTMPESGVVYVNIHLDYGLKKLSGFTNSAGSAVNSAVIGGSIINLRSYEFQVSGSVSDTQTVQSENNFKRDPGFAGVVTDSLGNPIVGVKVVIESPSGYIMGTVYTDENGVYLFGYKHTGKTATFAVALPDCGLTKTVSLKSNSLAVVDFVVS